MFKSGKNYYKLLINECMLCVFIFQRFNDWKNSTRAKYRKIVEDSKQTRAGPKIDIKLSQFEDRGLAVWGKVAVTGTARVPVVVCSI